MVANLNLAMDKSVKISCTTLTRHLKFSGDLLDPPVQTWTPAPVKHIYESNGRFVCGFCHKSYGTRGTCSTHYHVHLGSTTCGICYRVLAHKGALRTHMIKHLGSIRCERCHQTFASKAVLGRHQSKCGNKPQKK
jgi:hypothetical protein